MNQLRVVVTPRKIDFSVTTESGDGRWVPVRPLPYYTNPIREIIQRFTLAWRVFIGRYDALDWENPSGNPRKYKV